MSEGQCVMFAGQSVQETGMCTELWKLKAAREILDRLTPSLGADLEQITTEMPDPDLALTINSQRAIHAHHLGHWFAYKAAHPEIVLNGAIGHSMGVVAALVAAEALSVEDSALFIRARAESFSKTCKAFSEQMGLAAVSTEFFPDIEKQVASVPGVSMALHNTIGRGVLGGTKKAIEAFSAKAAAEGWPIKVKVLKVEGPYHTAAFTPTLEDLRKAAAGLKIQKPKCPVYMGTSGKKEEDPERIRELLVTQADSLERHFDAVWAAYDDGCRDFIEIAHKPQPVTWIGDQLQDEDGNLQKGVTSKAVTTSEIAD